MTKGKVPHVELSTVGESGPEPPRKSHFRNFSKEQKGRKVTLKFDADGPVSMEALQKAIQDSHGGLRDMVRHKAGRQRRETRILIGLLLGMVGVFGILGIIGGTSLLKVGHVEEKLDSGEAAAAMATETANLNTIMQSIAKNGGADGQLSEDGLATARKQFAQLKRAIVTDATGQNQVCNVAGTTVKQDGSFKIQCQDGESLAWVPDTNVHSETGRRLSWWDNWNKGFWWSSNHEKEEPVKETPAPTKQPTTGKPTEAGKTGKPTASPKGPSECNKNKAGGCKQCVETNDAWCGINNWDQACLNLCSATCKDSCINQSRRPRRIFRMERRQHASREKL